MIREPADLAARVQCALALAGEMVDGLAHGAQVLEGADASGSLKGKVIAETAMLLYAVAPRAPEDTGLSAMVASLAQRLAPLARGEEVGAALCLDPANALEHATAHILLTRLGYCDPSFDELLCLSLRTNSAGAPERLPCRRLEHLWLAGAHQPAVSHEAAEAVALADSAAGHPLDALQLGRDDVYAFTHAVFYATDAGWRPWPGRRWRADLEADALVALGLALDEHDHDLTSEVLWIWPMLGLGWHPAAVLAFDRVAAMQDTMGLLPGRGFDPAVLRSADAQAQARHLHSTCYHATFVFAFLCAAALRARTADATPAPVRPRGCGAALLDRMDLADPRSAWCVPLREAPVERLDAVAPLLLAAALRRAARAGDLGEVRRLLQIAQDAALASGPACAQAAGLLMRAVSMTPEGRGKLH